MLFYSVISVNVRDETKLIFDKTTQASALELSDIYLKCIGPMLRNECTQRAVITELN